jgi:hypothetical protein
VIRARLCYEGPDDRLTTSSCSTPLSYPDLAPMGYFLFQRVKEEMVGIHLSQESFKKIWGGGHQKHRRGEARHRLRSVVQALQPGHSHQVEDMG